MNKIRYKIELVGLTDCKNFVNRIEKSGKKSKINRWKWILCIG